MGALLTSIPKDVLESEKGERYREALDEVKKAVHGSGRSFVPVDPLFFDLKTCVPTIWSNTNGQINIVLCTNQGDKEITLVPWECLDPNTMPIGLRTILAPIFTVKLKRWLVYVLGDSCQVLVTILPKGEEAPIIYTFRGEPDDNVVEFLVNLDALMTTPYNEAERLDEEARAIEDLRVAKNRLLEYEATMKRAKREEENRIAQNHRKNQLREARREMDERHKKESGVMDERHKKESGEMKILHRDREERHWNSKSMSIRQLKEIESMVARQCEELRLATERLHKPQRIIEETWSAYLERNSSLRNGHVEFDDHVIKYVQEMVANDRIALASEIIDPIKVVHTAERDELDAIHKAERYEPYAIRKAEKDELDAIHTAEKDELDAIHIAERHNQSVEELAHEMSCKVRAFVLRTYEKAHASFPDDEELAKLCKEERAKRELNRQSSLTYHERKAERATHYHSVINSRTPGSRSNKARKDAWISWYHRFHN